MEKLFKEELEKVKRLSYMLMPLDIQLFASGTIDGGKYNNYYSYYITWSSTPNTAGNYSDVTANWIMKKTASDPYGAFNTSGSSKVTLYIDTVGSGETTANFDLRSSAVGTTKVLKSWTKRIDHNSDGTRKVKIGGLHKTGLDWGNKEIYDHEVTLDTIPRASDLSATNGVIGSSATITIGKKSTTFTDSVKIVFGSITKYLKTDGTLSDTEVKLSTNGSITWTIPTSFYAQIPTSKSDKATITSKTYNGTTVVGTKSTTVDILTSDSSKAVISEFSVIDSNSATVALTGDANKIVKYLSKPKVTLKATSNTNSTVKSFTIKNADGSGSNGTNTTGTLAVEYTFSNGVESGTFDATVVDGRDYSTYATQLKKTLIEYIKLGFTKLEVKRTEPTSNTINANITGNWFNGSFGSVTNVLNNITCNYRESGASSWTTGGTLSLTKSGNTFSYSGTLGTNFDYQKSYDFQFIISDKAMSITTTGTVTKGQAVMLIGDEEVIINGDVTVNGDIYLTGKSSILPSHFYRYLYDGANCYDHYYDKHSSSDVSYANLRVHANQSSTFKTLRFGGDGTFTWDGKNVSVPNILYDNETGTTGTISNIANSNYKYIEIMYSNNDGHYQSVRVKYVAGKKIALDISRPNTNNTPIQWTAIVSLNESSIVFDDNRRLLNNTYATGNYIYIHQVVGYK